SAWADLYADGLPARRAFWQLIRTPRQALPFLQEHLRPPPATVDRRLVERFLKDLESDRFAVREKAGRELDKLGEAAEPALRLAIKAGPELEALRRMEMILEKIEVRLARDRQRQMRALEMLEYQATPEGRRLLQTLAKGPSGAWLTDQAKAALGRLERPSNQ